MIEVVIDSIRVSLMSQHRIVVLKDMNTDRYLPIWIGPFEAEAITVELQEVPPQRPLTHDLLKTIIREMGGRVVHVLVKAPIFVAEQVMERAAIEPDEDVEQEVVGSDSGTNEDVDDKKLSAFADFVNSLDLDLDDEEDNN